MGNYVELQRLPSSAGDEEWGRRIERRPRPEQYSLPNKEQDARYRAYHKRKNIIQCESANRERQQSIRQQFQQSQVTLLALLSDLCASNDCQEDEYETVLTFIFHP